MSREILSKYNIKAKKSLGQNFLIDEEALRSISNSIEVKNNNIIEVGPGYGALTEKLLNRFPKSLYLVELDSDMIEILKDREEKGELQTQNIDYKIHSSDVLEFIPDFKSYSLIANIPYYITSPILRHFLYTIQNRPEKMSILMQKDVGDKILGKGKNKSSVLSLMIAKKCFAQEHIVVLATSFIPAPKVESSVLVFERHNHYEHLDDTLFLDTIKVGFASPRKKLLKNLIAGGFEKDKVVESLKILGKDENVRGEDLSMEEWSELILML